MKTTTAVSLPAPGAPRVKPPNYMVFTCSLDRIEKTAAKSKDAARIERTRALRAEAHAAYKAKDYAKAVELHDAAHRAATEPVAGVAAVTATSGSPRPPKAKRKAARAAPKKAPAKPAAKQPPKVANPAKGAPKLSALGAAAQVLGASKEPMNAKAIIEAMTTKGLWTSPGGKTPDATLSAALQRDIAAKGRESRFKKVERGLYAASGRGV